MELISMPEDNDGMTQNRIRSSLHSLFFKMKKKKIYSVMNLGQGQRYYDRALASEDGVHKAEL